ncbi:hypothetical protein WDW86_11830 [Bdellovibrionota bacterium FG-2]
MTAVRLGIVLVLSCSVLASVSCGRKSSGDEHPGAAYADFAKLTSDAVPSGFKTGGTAAFIDTSVMDLVTENQSTYLADGCASGDECLMVSTTDSFSGEIFSKVWAMDYNGECTAAGIAAGTCFDCPSCNSAGTKYNKPTMISDPTACATLSSMEAKYVNFGFDPCAFDSKVSNVANFDTCKASAGKAVDISTAIPWYASWGVPQSPIINGFSKDSTQGGSMWWGFVSNDPAKGKYFVSIDSTMLNAGIKDVTNNFVMYFGMGSTLSSYGADGPSLSGYAGTLSGSSFETIQVRDQGANKYINRIKSNDAGTHIYAQSWDPATVPLTAADIAAKKDSPLSQRCVKLGAKVALAKFVPLSECATAFGGSLPLDAAFIFKLIPLSALHEVQFTTALTADAASACF